MRRFIFIGVVALGLLLWTSVAPASELIGRNAQNVKLWISPNGQKALASFREPSKKTGKLVWKHVYVSGAVNANTPDPNGQQVKFTITYAGGQPTAGELKSYKKCWSRSASRFGRAAGLDPASTKSILEWPFGKSPSKSAFGGVNVCQARDGSYWMLQEWQYWLPFFGYQPWLPYQSDWALHISHWTGDLPQLELFTDWISPSRGALAPHNLFGRLTYAGVGVYGFKVLPGGVPGDGFGRVVYIYTLDSLLGPGWWGLTGILARNPSGMFCHSMIAGPTYSNYPNPHVVDAGNGTAYLVLVEGPGATPAIEAEVGDAGDWNPLDPAKVARLSQGTELLQQWNAPDACRKYHP